MKVQILGTGCAKCKKLFENASAAIKQLGITCEIEKIEKMEDITDMGAMMTPALAIDGEIKTAGKVMDVAGIVQILKSQS